MASTPERIDLSAEQAGSLIERVRSRSLDEKDYEVLVGIIETVLFLHQALSRKSHSIQRLLRRIFGVKTESATNILKDSSDKVSRESGSPSGSKSTPKEGCAGKRGHGRNGADSYPRARRIPVTHEDHRSGDPCPLCPKGKLYLMSAPAVVVRMRGHAPVEPAIFECERLRCNLCGEVFTAKLPEGVGHDKYDESARALIACMKYGSGFPFHRLEKLQKSMQAPLPASTQWDEAERLADMIHPVYPELARQAARGEILHNDDTGMRVLSLAKRLAGENAKRKGIFTTGVVSIHEDKKIALFFTGNRHAGENLETLLKQRAAGLVPDSNVRCPLPEHARDPEGDRFSASTCAQLRRYVHPFPGARFIELLGKVYHHDTKASQKGLSPSERLRFHQAHSAPVMDEIKEWMADQIDGKRRSQTRALARPSITCSRMGPVHALSSCRQCPLDNNV